MNRDMCRRSECRVFYEMKPLLRGLAFCLLAEAAMLSPNHLLADERDPRVRTFVDPMRIVWETGCRSEQDGWGERARSEGVAKLLGPKRGQVNETAFFVDLGCKLVNAGETPGFVLDFGRELHGGIQLGLGAGVSPGARLRIRFGESISEAMSEIGEKHATNDHAVRDMEISVPRLGQIEVGNTGFRFVRVDLVSGGTAAFEFVRAVSLMRDMPRKGAFSCSDARLNAVWETAVRTVHLCSQEYLWDGIKRDRLVWMGDMHPETMALLSAFGATEVLPKSLDFMIATTEPKKWMNYMPAYTLWFVVNFAEWHRFMGDRSYLERHADYLRKTFAAIREHVAPDNTWGVEGFLDWPTQHNPTAVRAGMQGLAALAFDEIAYLEEELGDASAADDWRTLAARFRTVKCDPAGAKSAAALLALGGIAEPKKMYAEVLGKSGLSGVSTFYGYYMLEAMCLAGERQRALDTVRDYWGAMLDMGATSFWENFDVAWTNNAVRIDELPTAGKKDVHGDFGEFCYPGLRHSLCHGWSSGPAAWCIRRILGIRPLTTGYRKVEVSPFLGDLAWAEGALPLPTGESVKVRVERKEGGEPLVTVDAPVWVEIVKNTSLLREETK